MGVSIHAGREGGEVEEWTLQAGWGAYELHAVGALWQVSLRSLRVIHCVLGTTTTS